MVEEKPQGDCSIPWDTFGRHIALHDSIRRLGSYSVELDLHRDVDAKIQVVVFDPAAPVIVAPVAEETESHNEE